jgi:hypothetical protein
MSAPLLGALAMLYILATCVGFAAAVHYTAKALCDRLGLYIVACVGLFGLFALANVAGFFLFYSLT